MSLQNNAQNKKFTVSGNTKTKKAPTKSFYVAERPREKMFQGTRSFFTKIFGTRTPATATEKANLQTREQTRHPANPRHRFRLRRRAAREWKQSERMPSPSFPTRRPFLVRGKSQKALSQQDRPLTIDEVRELLNKNK